MNKAIGTILVFLCFVGSGATFYVSPTGSASNPGTIASPNSLTNMIQAAHTLASAGDTIYLLGGTYTNTLFNDLVAPSNNPIVMRSAPGQWAVIDPQTTNTVTGAVLTIYGSGNWWRDMEIMNSATNRYLVRLDGVGMNTGAAGQDNKLINLFIHDNGDGAFASYQSTNAEVYGCVIINNGYQLSDRGHGHNLYIQNRSFETRKTISENIGLNVMNVGMNARSSNLTANEWWEGNVVANSGSTSTNGWVANFHTEGETVDQISWVQNFGYYPVPAYGQGFYSLSTNGTLTVVSNVFANSYSQIFYWTNTVFNANTQYAAVDFRPTVTNYTTADYNYYYKVALNFPISYQLTNVTLANWQTYFGNDTHGTATANAASGKWIYLRQNKYEPTRANLIVYNWDRSDNVTVNISSVCPVGNAFTLRNAADYGGNLVLSNNYAGGNISIPMTNLNVAVPIGMASAPTNTAPTFAVFVLDSTPLPKLASAISLKVRNVIVNP